MVRPYNERTGSLRGGESLTATIDSGTASPIVPPAYWQNRDAHGHSVQFYEDDSFLLDGLGRFMGSALGAGDSGIVIATPEHRDELAELLNARGVDTERATAQGRYATFDAEETLAQFMRQGWPDRGLFADVVGGIIRDASTASGGAARIAAFGEMVALLWAAGKPDAAIRLEQLWNELAMTHSFYLHCAYPMRFFSRESDGSPIARVCAEHAAVVPTESYTSLVDEDERLRAIALLQQKARALEVEIEERKTIEESLQRREAELREALAARDEFLSIAAHELRTPLTGVRLVAQLLLREATNLETSDKLRAALSTIDTQTGKLSELVSRLLDRSQIEAGKLRIQPAPTDLVQLVQGVVSGRSESGRHSFVVDAPERLEACVDPIRFEQVVTNLVDNAVKYSPDGGSIAVKLSVRDGGGASLSVTDHGVGVPPEQRDHIFDRFYQAHRDRHLTGMGLGLYLTRQIVQLHGGTVRIEDPGHPGTRFVVDLPPMAIATL